ncbi:MAG: efflux RND transporter permease subunit, partial [Acidobacteriota bacterium]
MRSPHPIHPVVRFAVERRVTMAMILLGVLVLGALALDRLPLEFLPTNSSSNVSVSVTFPSSSPEEVAQRVVRPLEESLGTLGGIESLSSSASADEARLNVSFLSGTDMDLATVEVRDRVDRVRHRLPDDITRIRIRRFQTTDLPVLRFHLAAEWPQDRLYDFAERTVQRRLERLPGVAQVQIRGLRSRQVQIRIDSSRMAAHGVEVRELSGALRRNHLDLSAGTLDENQKRYLVRALGQLRSLEEIRQLPLRSDLRLGDVAEVLYAYPQRESFNFLNGAEALSVRVFKTSDGNLLEITDRVKEELDRLAADPRFAGHASRVYRDSSKDVRLGLSQLRDAGLFGGLLAILAVFVFLRRVRTTALVAIANPVSVVFTFVLLFLLRQLGLSNLTLNVVSLMGLVIALGMLVDSSIVVIESIYRRMETFGESSRTAALRGASEVALPILASTVTTLCVFVPALFLRSGGGFFSRFLAEIGTTICAVMIASLLVALTVVPMSCALILGREKPPARSPRLERLESLYERLLSFTQRRRLAVLVVASGLLWGSWHLFSSIERSFGGRTEERQITLNVDTPRSYSQEQTARLFEELLAILEPRREELEIADITSSYYVGSGRSRGGRRERSLEIYLRDESESQLTTSEVRDRVRALMPRKAGVDLRIALSRGRGGGGGSGLEIELTGDDTAVLERVGLEVAAGLEQMPGLADVDLSLESGDQELRVRVDPARSVQAGLSTGTVAQAVQSALSERRVETLSTDGREVDIVMLVR